MILKICLQIAPDEDKVKLLTLGITHQDRKLISWKLHSSSGVHTIMTSTGLVFHMLVESKYPLTKEVLSQMLELKLETEEESSMALELIKVHRLDKSMKRNKRRFLLLQEIKNKKKINDFGLILNALDDEK
ncbi:hypothetical protein Tco_0040410 [Tanacetum coccineum]